MMKFRHISIILCLSILISIFTGGCSSAKAVKMSLAERNRLRGQQIFKASIEKFYIIEEQKAYQYYPFKNDQVVIADIWHYSSLQEAALYYRQLFPDEKWAIDIETSITDGLKYYIEKRQDNYIVYGMYRAHKPYDNIIKNLYDDNQCILRNLIHNYKLTKNPEMLETIKNNAEYIANGWDSSINKKTGKEWGGNYQGPGIGFKSVSANAIIISDFMQIHDLCTSDADKEKYLSLAKKYYHWVNDVFRFEDGLYGNLIGCEQVDGVTTLHGNPSRDMYTYNQGAMIEAGVRLYKATGDVQYLEDARETARASHDFFGRRDIIEGMYQLPFNVYHWFNLVLLRGYIALAEVDSSFGPYIDEIQESLDYAYDNFYRDGFLPCNWLTGWIYGYDFDEYMNIMDQTAHAQFYFMLAQYYHDKTGDGSVSYKTGDGSVS